LGREKKGGEGSVSCLELKLPPPSAGVRKKREFLRRKRKRGRRGGAHLKEGKSRYVLIAERLMELILFLVEEEGDRSAFFI